jgi:integrase/recombinase XerD
MGIAAEDQQLLAAHLRVLRLQKGLSEHTTLSYGRDLSQYAEFLGERGASLKSASGDDVRAFLAGGEWRPSTRARKAAALRSFYKEAIQNDVVDVDPTRALAGPRLESRLPRVLSVTEVERMLSLPKGDPLGLRDRAMLETLYGAGLRASEVLSLRLQDIDLEVGFVRTVGKGGKERVVPLGRMAVEALRAYDERGRRLLGGAGRLKAPELFLNDRGRRLSRQGLHLIIKRLREALICALCRRCWGMPICRPRRSIPTLAPLTCRRPTEMLIRGRGLSSLRSIAPVGGVAPTDDPLALVGRLGSLCRLWRPPGYTRLYESISFIA